MPLLDLEVQRRAVEIGRFRLGYSTPRDGGGKTPKKLETFRFTSRSETSIRAIAGLWGGTPRPWAEARGQWEVFTEATEIPVVVPGGPAVLSQMYESWDKGVIQRRCDGQMDTVSESPCVCKARQLVGRNACKPISRIGLILPDVPELGTWRLETGGMNAALELGGSAELLGQMREAGQMVPAVVRLETRKSGMNVYPVPVLVPVVTFRELATGAMQGRTIGELLPAAPVPLAAIGSGPVGSAPGPVLLALADIPDDHAMGTQIQAAPDADRLRELWTETIRLGWLKSYGGQPYKMLIDHLNDRAEALGLPTTRASA